MKKVPLSNSNIPLFLRYLKLYDAEPHKEIENSYCSDPSFPILPLFFILQK